MANDYLCGLFRRRARPTQSTTRDEGLRGVEFSPRSSMASSTDAQEPAPVASNSAQATPATTNLDNPEVSGYYSPPAPRPAPRPEPFREVRGYYAPEPAIIPIPPPRSNAHPKKTTYS
ncbi:uncharacterized protein GGS22DRAFT_161034 [Annulohypoxylon maeteangense]|uniref:uncharacterized protein n=1 Tax=Annulohypoxylon maeteangense TaxID=1927788 RepID=UPI0020074AF6|nr:uncharacterized protein GGS22DRAFT_161034 [Annulohypoxylon maeteangense]KAI0885482.1 hypothetical protein GGS22DRAFT_161034 [Annulohypoxylon maeteangense]